MTQRSIDIAIVGGGLVGALLAKLLSKLNFKIILLEKQFLPAASAEGEPVIDRRALALNFGTLSLLKKLLHFDAASLGAVVQHIMISDQGGFGRVELDANAEHLPYFGAVIPITLLTRTLQQSVFDDNNIQCIEGECSALLENPHAVEVEVNNAHTNEVYQAKLVIGADGAASKIRELLNISAVTHNYEQSALIGNVKIEGLHAHTAFERFTREGPLALLPLDAEHMTLVWVMTNKHAAIRQRLPEAILLQDLQDLMGFRAGRFVNVGATSLYPLKQVLAEKTYVGRVGILGNAAHSIHPVAAQGFNLSVRDVLGLYQTLKRCQGDYSAPKDIWQEYIEVRRHDQQRTIRLTDTLLKVFGHGSKVAALTRDTLMLGLELMPWCKEELNEIMVGVH